MASSPRSGRRRCSGSRCSRGASGRSAGPTVRARTGEGELEEELGVPVIDLSIAALKRAESAALLKRQCGWVPSRKWSCEAPPEEEIAAFGGFDEGEAFGNRLVVAPD